MESTEDNKDPVALYSEEDIKEIKEKLETFLEFSREENLKLNQGMLIR